MQHTVLFWNTHGQNPHGLLNVYSENRVALSDECSRGNLAAAPAFCDRHLPSIDPSSQRGRRALRFLPGTLVSARKEG